MTNKFLTVNSFSTHLNYSTVPHTDSTTTKNSLLIKSLKRRKFFYIVIKLYEARPSQMYIMSLRKVEFLEQTRPLLVIYRHCQN